MKIPQNSKLEFYSKIYINKDETIPFRSRAQLEAYFALHKKFDVEMSQKKFSYFRRTGELKVELSAAQVEQCNYLMFVNPDFENIKYYCRIRDWEYVSNKVTRVYYDIDVWCTYFEKCNYSVCQIEREHLSDESYQKSLVNPYDTTIYEFQTEEGLKVDMDMEPIYFRDGAGGWDLAQFPGIDKTAKKDSCIVMMVADFDTSAISDYVTTFCKYFDVIVDSTGNILEPAGGPDGESNLVIGTKSINIGRAYGLYMCQVENPFDPNSIISWLDKTTPVSKAVKWLNKQGLTDQILGIIQMTKKSWDIYLSPNGDDSLLEVTPRNYEVENKKLLLFPYQYLRVYNYEGDVKEYKYEKFIDIAAQPDASNRKARFRYLTLFDNVPMTSLVPIDYKIEGANVDERIDCVQFPQVGYSTNTFDAFVANQMSKNLQERTGTFFDNASSAFNAESFEYHGGGLGKGSYTPGLQGLKEILGDVGTSFRATGSYVTQNPQALAAAGQAFSGNVGGALNTIGNLPTWDYKAAAKEWRAGDNTLAASALGSAKPAFVAYDYHAGSSNGTIGYYIPNNNFAPGSYLFVRARIRQAIVEVYDRYFTLYGYKSGRIGIPRILNYILGYDGGLPHFHPYGDVKVTYVKTNGLHVEYVKSSVAKTIEDMFNSGIRFVIPPDMPEV